MTKLSQEKTRQNKQMFTKQKEGNIIANRTKNKTLTIRQYDDGVEQNLHQVADTLNTLFRIDRDNTITPNLRKVFNAPACTHITKNMMNATTAISLSYPFPTLTNDTYALKINTSLDSSKKESTIDLSTLAVVSLAGQRLTQLSHIQRTRMLKDKTDDNTSYIAKPLDFIASNIIHKDTDRSLQHAHLYDHRTKLSFLTQHSVRYLANDLTTTDHTRLYYTGSKASFNLSLKTYKDIGDKCYAIAQRHNITHAKLAAFISDIHHKNHTSTTHPLSKEEEKYLTNVSSLLFLTETSRHKSSYITHKMFIDLVKAEKLYFNDMHTTLPMAIRGAVKASIAIDQAIFPLLKNYELYYNTKRPFTLDTYAVQKFISRTTKIVQDWLKCKGFQGSTEVEISEFINSHIIDWYGTKNANGQQRFLASCIKLEFGSDSDPHSESSSSDFRDEERYSTLDTTEHLGLTSEEMCIASELGFTLLT